MARPGAGAAVATALFAILCCLPGCVSQRQESTVTQEVLESYRCHTPATDPGGYAFLYEGLPESLEELCTLVKHQLTHPLELGALRKELPEDRHFEDFKYPTVQEMLAGLHQLDPDGLRLDRRPENRLVVACWHHAMLLASILKHRGIPVRVRVGFALYIAPDSGLHVGHAVCEVWNDKKGRWMLVDPDRRKVNFRRGEFEFPAAAWHGLRGTEIESRVYHAATLHGASAILHMLCLDLKSVLNDNSPYWKDLMTAEEEYTDLSRVTATRIEVFDRLAALLDDPDVHLDELRDLRGQYEYLR